MSFSSNVTNKSRLPNRGEMDEDKEQRIRQEYEYKLLDLERRLAAVEHERDDHKRALASEKAKRLEWEEEVRGLKERAMTHASSLRSMQHEVDVQRDKGEAERKMADENVRSAEEETQRWRERAEQLEEDGRRVEVESQGLRERLERVEREGRGREQAGNVSTHLVFQASNGVLRDELPLKGMRGVEAGRGRVQQ
jgi:chromosome segregation ATPase